MRQMKLKRVWHQLLQSKGKQQGNLGDRKKVFWKRPSVGVCCALACWYLPSSPYNPPRQQTSSAFQYRCAHSRSTPRGNGLSS